MITNVRLLQIRLAAATRGTLRPARQGATNLRPAWFAFFLDPDYHLVALSPQWQ